DRALAGLVVGSTRAGCPRRRRGGYRGGAGEARRRLRRGTRALRAGRARRGVRRVPDAARLRADRLGPSAGEDRPDGPFGASREAYNLGQMNDGQVLLWCIALIALELQHLKWIVWEHWTCPAAA